MMTELEIMEECTSAKRIKLSDKEFNPPIEMLVNDFDDERTLDEEEALESTEDPQAELSSLQKERDMPLEELLALYGYTDAGEENESNYSEHGEILSGCKELEDIISENSKSLNKNELEEGKGDKNEDDDDDDDKCVPSMLRQLYENNPSFGTSLPSASCRPLRSLSRPQSEEEDEDYDYSPDEEDCKKTIMVGWQHQALIPEGLCKYDDALPYENEDKLLWDPNSLTSEEIENYLIKAREPLSGAISNAQSINSIPGSFHIRDDEQALYLLLQCGYNVEEALRRRRMNVIAPTDTMSLWSEEECRNFENGLKTYGKNFHHIQQNKVRTRSVGELVQFYYLWKKTERHDTFANKAKYEKKKYSLHPGITDYMDRFLEEQEGGVGTSGSTSGTASSSGSQKDRSSSPNIQCLIYGDRKRHHRSSKNTHHINKVLSSSSLSSSDIKGVPRNSKS